MVIAVISDTHMPRGRRRLPQACLDRLASSDLIVHAGDFDSAAVLEELRGLGPPVRAVHGNTDDAVLRRILPARTTIDAGGATVGLVHDAGPARGRLARLRRWFPQADAVVFGHSHLPLCERREGFAIFNPGSPTERRRAPARSMGLARVSKGAVHFEHVVLE